MFPACRMTSKAVANALLRELNTFGGTSPGVDGYHGVAFQLDFEPATVWPDLPFDTSSRFARYPEGARDEVRAIVEAAALLLGESAPKALHFINAHMRSALLCRSSAF